MGRVFVCRFFSKFPLPGPFVRPCMVRFRSSPEKISLFAFFTGERPKPPHRAPRTQVRPQHDLYQIRRLVPATDCHWWVDECQFESKITVGSWYLELHLLHSFLQEQPAEVCNTHKLSSHTQQIKNEAHFNIIMCHPGARHLLLRQHRTGRNDQRGPGGGERCRFAPYVCRTAR